MRPLQFGLLKIVLAMTLPFPPFVGTPLTPIQCLGSFRLVSLQPPQRTLQFDFGNGLLIASHDMFVQSGVHLSICGEQTFSTQIRTALLADSCQEPTFDKLASPDAAIGARRIEPCQDDHERTKGEDQASAQDVPHVGERKRKIGEYRD